MNSTKQLISLTGMLLAIAAATAAARAQEAPATIVQAAPAAIAQETPIPGPAATEQPTLIDRQYDGALHITAAPYIWGPTVKANLQFSIPRLPRLPGHGGGIAQSSVQAGPSDYLPKLNSAFMFAFDARKGVGELFGDLIYLNSTTSATFAGSVSGPLGKVTIPFTINSDARLAVAMWEAAAGLTVARTHNADLTAFAGFRSIPLTFALSYNAVIGKRGIIAPSGNTSASTNADNVIFGLHGRAFFNNDHWFVPYYGDWGFGMSNQSWQAYGGAGYAFNHGQTLLLMYRALSYNDFPPGAHIQKMNLYGPLLGYTFQL
jgi:hypothetical protein